MDDVKSKLRRLGLKTLATGLAVVVGRRVVQRDDLARPLGTSLAMYSPALCTALHVIGDDQADVFAGSDTDVGDHDGNVLGVEDRLDRLGDHDAIAGENQNAVDLLCANVLEIGDLLGLVVVAAVSDNEVDVDALGLPLRRPPSWRR